MKILKIILLISAIFSFGLSQLYAAGITVGSGASVTLSGSPAVTTVDINNSGAISAGAGTINLGGDWTNSGTFNAQTGTFSVVGSGTSMISGSNSFYNFSSVAPSKTITFSAGSTQTISNNFTLTGASGQRISLRSIVSGTRWNINPQGAAAVSFVDVQDSNNTNANSITPSNSLDSGNNPGWVFGALGFTSATQSLLTGVESDSFDFNIGYSNSNSAQRNISVGLASDSLGPYEFHAVSGGSTVSSATVSSGATSGSFFYLDNHTGNPTLTISSTGYTSATQQTTVSNALFTLSVSSPQVAGSDFTLTITAKDALGNTLTSYTGTVNLTANYVTPSTGTGTLGVASTSAFVNGVATITNQSFSDCGTITIAATDAAQSANTGTSANVVFRPFDFSVVASSLDSAADSRHTVGKPFTLAVTARNAQGETCPNYTGDANLSINYVTPSASQSGTLAATSLDSTDFSGGIAGIPTQSYNKWGTITITAADATLTTQTGTSTNIIFVPKDFLVSLSASPPARTFYYTNENFSVTVTARDFNDSVVSNYKGSVAFSGSGLTLPADYAFVDADSGVHSFSGVNGASETTTVLSVKDAAFNSVSGSSSSISIKSATINVVSTSGPVGPVTVQVRILDSSGNLITTDNSTQFTVSITETVENGSVISQATSEEITVSGGIGFFTVNDSEAETVTITVSATPLVRPISGVVRFGTVSGGGVGIEFWREVPGGAAEEVSEE